MSRPSITREFRRALGAFVTGVTVVTTDSARRLAARIHGQLLHVRVA